MVLLASVFSKHPPPHLSDAPTLVCGAALEDICIPRFPADEQYSVRHAPYRDQSSNISITAQQPDVELRSSCDNLSDHAS